MRIDRYGSANFTSDTAPCAKHTQTYNPYFRYSERHYYFGYDRELDTYDIYLNPDFLHVHTTNSLGLSGGPPGVTFIDANPGVARLTLAPHGHPVDFRLRRLSRLVA
jgi:hypothetical protein